MEQSPPQEIQQSELLSIAASQRNRPARLLRLILRAFLVLVAFIFLILLPVILKPMGWSLTAEYYDYLIVMLLGSLVGFVEIISRYPDAPFKTAMTWPGLLYMSVNALVATAALWLIRLYGGTFVPVENASPEIRRWTQVFVAGLGAMAIFRSSLLMVGKEGDEVSIGPNAVLKILLSAIDREVDRFRGQERAQSVKMIMESIDYEDAIQDLTVVSKALMQNLSEDDSKKIDEAKKKFEILTDIDVGTRKYLLGLHIMDVVGEDILRQAINIRGKDYYKDRATRRLQQKEQEQASGSSEQKLSDLGKRLKAKYAKEESAEMAERSKEENQPAQISPQTPADDQGVVRAPSAPSEAPPAIVG